MRIVSVLKRTLGVPAQLRYFVADSSFGIDRLGGDHADGTYGISYAIGL